MQQTKLPLLGEIRPPRSVSTEEIQGLNFRQVCRYAWQHKRIANLTKRGLAANAGLVYQHVTDYFHSDDKPSRRSIPAYKVAAIESVLGNTAISQWLALQAGLTVIETLQADQKARAA